MATTKTAPRQPSDRKPPTSKKAAARKVAPPVPVLDDVVDIGIDLTDDLDTATATARPYYARILDAAGAPYVLEFPAPQDLHWTDALALTTLALVSDNPNPAKAADDIYTLFNSVLSPEDARVLATSKGMTLPKIMRLAVAVAEHYQAVVGDPGE